MSKYISQEMAKALGAGLLSVPDTHVKSSDQAFNEAGDCSDLQRLASGLFAGGNPLGIWRRTEGTLGKD